MGIRYFIDPDTTQPHIYGHGVTAVEIEGRATRFTVDRVRPFPQEYTPQALVLRSTGEPIAPNFIRSYAICLTPDFLRE